MEKIKNQIKRRSSLRVRDAIIKKFPETSGESIYKEEELFEGFAEIFRNNGIDAKVNLAIIKKYYGAHNLKGQRDGLVKLYLFKPDFDYD